MDSRPRTDSPFADRDVPLIASRTRPVAVACGLTAVLLVFVEVTDVPDPVQMPVAPAWSAAASAGVLVGLALARKRLSRLTVVVVAAVAGLGMLSGSVLAVPHTILMVIVWAVGQATGGGGSFTVDPQWLTTSTHLANLASAAAVVAWLVLEVRLLRGLCPACGRVDAVPSARGRRWLPWLAGAAIAAALPYLVLKTGWSLGWRAGLTGHAFDDVSFASPGFGDTVVCTALSIVVSVLMARETRGQVLRAGSIIVGAMASVMLLPVGIVAAVQLPMKLFGGAPIDESEIAAWAFLLVYAGFLVWGLALAGLTVTYWRVTRAACPRADAHRGGRVVGPSSAGRR